MEKSEALRSILKQITCLDFSLVKFDYTRIEIFEQICGSISQSYQGKAICFPAIDNAIFAAMGHETDAWNCITAMTELIHDNPQLSSVSFNGCTILGSETQNRLELLLKAIIENDATRQLNLANCGIGLSDIKFAVKNLKTNPVPIALNLKGNVISDKTGLFESGLFEDLCKHPAFLTSFDYDWKDNYRSHYCMALKINDYFTRNRNSLMLLLKPQIGNMPLDVTKFIAYWFYMLDKKASSQSI